MSHARTLQLRRTVRWLQWQPVLVQLEARLQEEEQREHRSGLVRRLLVRLASPDYIKLLVDADRPEIRGPRREGKAKALKSEQDMLDLQRGLRAKDPSGVLKHLKLHAKDRPYLGSRASGHGLDGKEPGARGGGYIRCAS